MKNEKDKTLEAKGSGMDLKDGSDEDVGQRILENFKVFLKERAGLELVGTETVLEAIIQEGFSRLGGKTQIYVSDILKAIELKQKLGPLTGDGIQRKIDELLNVGKTKKKE
jgi:hypothetical protein